MDVEDGSGTETEPETTADVQGQDKASLNQATPSLRV